MAKTTEANSKTDLVEYVAVRDCMHDNKWYGRGKSIFAEPDFKHACFVKKSEYVEKKSSKFYDPTRDAMEKARLGEVMKGVYKN